MATPIQLKHSSQAGRVPDAGVLTSGELAINTNDVKAYIKNSDGQVVQIAGADNPTTDGRYVKLEGDDVTAQEITGTAGLKTAGLIESEGGVKVSGGSEAGVENGIYGTSAVRIVSKNTVGVTVNGQPGTAKKTLFTVGGEYAADNTEAFTARINADVNQTSGEVYQIFSRPTVNTTGAKLYGIGIHADLGTQGNAKAYWTNISASDDDSNFGFVSDNSAPNFFAGNTYIGGSTATSTLELWKSTLTQEQLERLQAGNYAVPANVTNPGNGEYARQWYYDQQDAETQALLDSGELEYPTPFAAATFTDTFALGDNTGINLNNDGSATFKGLVECENGFKMSGGYAEFDNAIGIGTPVNPALAMAVKGQSIFAADDDQYCIAVQKNTATAGMWLGSDGANSFRVSYPAGHAGFRLGEDGAAFVVGNTTDEDIVIEADGQTWYSNSVYIGGSNARNTLELWKSTLTEEQLERLEAGTLAIPETVSDPDNGFFARHWYYNQQDEETQARLDSGELKYPAQFAAETFTDTFDLGDNTNINLLSNGRGEFSSGLKVTGSNNNNQGISGDSQGVLLHSENIASYVRAANKEQAYGVKIESGRQGFTRGSSGDAYGLQLNSIYTPSNNTNVTGIRCVEAEIDGDLDGATIRGYSTGDFGSGADPDVVYYFVARDTVGRDAIADNNYGFFSGINNTTGKVAYNFYAEGSAPNYFKGYTTIADGPSFSAINSKTGKGINLNLSSGTAIAANQSSAATPCLWLNRTGSTGTGTFIRFGNGSLSDVESTNFPTGNCIKQDGSGVKLESLSDYRLKTNITEMPTSSDTVKALRPVIYEFTQHPNEARTGFIAHELQAVVPSAVSGTKDATEAIGTLTDYDGTVLETGVTEPSADELTYTEDVTDEEGVTTQEVRTKTWSATGTRDVYQGVDQTKLIPLLTKALQEALERIEVLEAAAAG